MFKNAKEKLFEKESTILEQVKSKLEEKDRKIEQLENLIDDYRQTLDRITKQLSEYEKKMIESNKNREIIETKLQNTELRRKNATAVAHRRKRKLDAMEVNEHG